MHFANIKQIVLYSVVKKNERNHSCGRQTWYFNIQPFEFLANFVLYLMQGICVKWREGLFQRWVFLSRKRAALNFGNIMQDAKTT